MGRRKSKHRKPKISNKIPAPEAVSSSSAPPSDALSSSAPPPPWIELPGDVTANILQRLGAEGILDSAQKVCTTWWKVCQDPAMWRVIYLRNPEYFNEVYAGMCRHAVDRSQGQLVDLTIDYFGDEELINYIANRSSDLKRLTLRGCYQISGISLTQAVKKLPELEELHLTKMPSVLAGDVEASGLSCPKLKSFSYNGRGSKHPRPKHVEYEDFYDEFGRDDYALAIRTSMPNLRHLRVFALRMQNERLEGILDGCPHLESLDLRQCYDLDLGGDLGKRCREQIKYLRLPFDSASDIQQLVGGPSDWDDIDVYDDESFDGFSDCDYYCDYEDYEQYDDYFSPLGYGFFGDAGFFDHDDVGPGFFDHDYF